jgi:hypothetical protein
VACWLFSRYSGLLINKINHPQYNSYFVKTGINLDKGLDHVVSGANEEKGF